MKDKTKHTYVSILDWRALSASEARPSGIDYQLSNGKSGRITDPEALRTFYYRIFHCVSTAKTKPHFL